MKVRVFFGVLVIVACCVVCSESEVSVDGLTVSKPKVWADAWVSNFTENSWYFLQGNGTIKGTFKYQVDQTQARMRISRDTGKSDRFCGSIYPFSSTPCDHLIRDGKRYIVFPEKKYCCMCCTASQGCGVVKNNWAENATAITSSVPGVNLYLIKGLQNNFYGEDATTGTPAKIYMEPISDMVFDTKTYSDAPKFTDDDFALPKDSGDCEKKCPYLSMCTLASLA